MNENDDSNEEALTKVRALLSIFPVGTFWVRFNGNVAVWNCRHGDTLFFAPISETGEPQEGDLVFARLLPTNYQGVLRFDDDGKFTDGRGYMFPTETVEIKGVMLGTFRLAGRTDESAR